jgi:homoserine dehydrogenase
MQPLRVGIIGFGTVGAGTYEVLSANREVIADRVGNEIVVKRIADLDLESDRGVDVDKDILTREATDIIEDPDIDLVVELIGGLDRARTFILLAMERGKHVVTANKALLATHGQEIYAKAEACRVSLGFEASVAGGIPVIGALRHGLCANRIQTIMGILNGTSNYILTRMAREGLPYDRVVQEAVRLGFAEDPPTLDVDGTDAAHKLAILASIAFGKPIDFDGVYREGITDLIPEDIQFADEFGFCVKLLAITRYLDDRVEARVHPALIPKDHIMANVDGVYNAIYVDGDFVGPNLYYGLGAGRRPTGSAVVSDIINLARQLRQGCKDFIPPLACVRPAGEALLIQPMDDLVTAYYFRFSALDQPGVLSKIAGILGEHQISIAAVIQKGREINGSVPIVMMTHEARESNVVKALSLMHGIDVLTDRTIMIRVQKGHFHGAGE